MIGLVHQSSLTQCLLLGVGLCFFDGVVFVVFVVLDRLIFLPGNRHLNLRLGGTKTQHVGYTYAFVNSREIEEIR